MNTFTIKLPCLLLSLVILLSTACKKDALEVKEEKRFMQTNAHITDPMFGAVSLTLRPNEQALINPGGDIVWSATYKISGKDLTVKVPDIDSKFKFSIVSDKELHGSNGEILQLIE
jgi:hypothetical protein